MLSLKEQKIYEEKIMEWIDDHFVLNEVEIEEYPFFPHGKLVRDKKGESMIVFWCVIYGRVDYRLNYCKAQYCISKWKQREPEIIGQLN